LVKGRALARPSERSERFEAVVRPGLPDTVVAATQKEKADAAELESERGKLIVTVSGTNQLLLIMPIIMATYRRRGVAIKTNQRWISGGCLTFG
jgi:hypothetical protein